jgi:hypothetical protein
MAKPSRREKGITVEHNFVAVLHQWKSKLEELLVFYLEVL